MPRKEANVENASTRKKNNLRVYEKAEDPSPYLFDINFKYESKELGKKESYCACWSNLKQKIGKCKLILFLFFLTAVVDTAVLAYVAMNRFKPHQQKTDRFNKEQEERNRTHKKELKKIEAEWKKLQNTDEVPESELLAAGRRRKKDLENQIEELNRRKRCTEKQYEKMSAEKDKIVKENSSNIVKVFKVGVIDKIKNKAREIFYGGADDKKESTDHPKENSICPAEDVEIRITENTEEYNQKKEIIDLENSATKDIDDLKALREKAQKFVDMRDALEKKVLKEIINGKAIWLSEEYEALKAKNEHDKNTDVVLVGMKKRIIFNNLSTTTEEQKNMEKEMKNFEIDSNNVINDLNKDKDMNLRKLREVMTAYHDTLKVWKKKKEEAANKLKNFRKIEELTAQVKNIYKKIAEDYPDEDEPDKYMNFEVVLKKTMEKNDEENTDESHKKYATRLKNIQSQYEERKELDRIQQAYEKYKIKKRLKNFSTIEGLRNDVNKIYKKLTGYEYTGTDEIFEDVFKESMKVLENQGGSPIVLLDYDYERKKLESIQNTYEAEEKEFEKMKEEEDE